MGKVDIGAIALGKDEDPEVTEVGYEKLHHMTPKGAKFTIDGEKVWLPRAHIYETNEESLDVATWLAEEHGWA